VITGVAVFTHCEQVLANPELRWILQRCVPLSRHFAVLQNTHCNYIGSVFELFTDVELRLRQHDTQFGGAIALQFPEFLDTRWRVFSMDAACTATYTDPATWFAVRTPLSQARFCGVAHACVREETPLPNMHQPTLEGDDTAVEQQDADDTDAPHAQVPVPSTGTASERLKQLYQDLPTGTVSHRYTPAGILRCLQLDRLLKPSVTLGQALSASSALLLEPIEHEALARDIQDHNIHLPSIAVLRSARVRLDIMAVLLEQGNWLRRDQIFFLLVDSSPQMGIDFLCVIEDSFVLPSPESVQAWLAIDTNLESGYSSQIDLMSSLGGGRSGLAKKSLNVANGRLMKCKDDAAFHTRRRQCKGVTSDQGTERGIGDTPLSVVPRFASCAPAGSPESFFQPLLHFQARYICFMTH